MALSTVGAAPIGSSAHLQATLAAFHRTIDVGSVAYLGLCSAPLAGLSMTKSPPGAAPLRALEPGMRGGAVTDSKGVAELRTAVAAMRTDHITIPTTGDGYKTHTSQEPNYSSVKINAIVDTAGEHGLTVSAHALGDPGVDLAVANSIHSIEQHALLTQESVRRVVEGRVRIALTNAILLHLRGIKQGDSRDLRLLEKLPDTGLSGTCDRSQSAPRRRRTRSAPTRCPSCLVTRSSDGPGKATPWD